MTFWNRHLVSRRDFLKVAGSSALSGSLIVRILTQSTASALASDSASAAVQSGQFGPFIEIGQRVRLVCHRSEMGQGIRTSFAMIVADELEVDMSQIDIVQADASDLYGDQSTDGSKSIRVNYDVLRIAAAKARIYLIRAASKKWNVPESELSTKSGRVYQKKTQLFATYSELAPIASKIQTELSNSEIALKKSRDFKVIGKDQNGIDLKSVLSGQAVFGADVRLPGMLYASIERAPQKDMKLDSFDASLVAGFGPTQIIELEPIGTPVAYTNASVAVLSDSTWAAMKGRELLKVKFKSSNLAMTRPLDSKIFESPAKNFRKNGDFNSLADLKKIEAEYETPYWVHQPMEPLVAVAHVQEGRCEVWAPTQDPGLNQREICTYLNLKPEQVIVHVTLLGGGFGRKSQPDFVMEAVALSKKAKKPVQVQWTREDEIKHGFYHAASRQRLEARIDSNKKLVGWKHTSAFPTIMRLFDPTVADVDAAELTMGALNMPYSIPNVLIEGIRADTPVRIGWLRSVCYAFNVFGAQSFIDEVAHALKKDPHEMRMEYLKPYQKAVRDKDPLYALDTTRLAAVQEQVAKKIEFHKKRAAGGGVGIASHHGFQSYCALALEVVVKKNRLRIVRAVASIDCGQIVNSDAVRAQMEGSILFGISQALYGDIHLKEGQVEESNFHDAAILKMNETPQIEVILNQNTQPPGGVGEPMVPLVAPALCNAIYAATKKRIRKLPIRL